MSIAGIQEHAKLVILPQKEATEEEGVVQMWRGKHVYIQPAWSSTHGGGASMYAASMEEQACMQPASLVSLVDTPTLGRDASVSLPSAVSLPSVSPAPES